MPPPPGATKAAAPPPPRRLTPARPPGEEPFYRPPYHNLRHPLIFYYAHPAVLYVNKLRVAGVLTQPINPYFETIFETVRAARPRPRRPRPRALD